MKNAVIAALILIAGALGGVLYSAHTAQAPTTTDKPVGEIIKFPKITPTSVTIAAANAGGAPTLAVATSSSRSYCAIVNDSANTVYLGLSGDGPTNLYGGTGIRLNATGGSYEITLDNLYTGAIYGIASSSSRLTVTCN